MKVKHIAECSHEAFCNMFNLHKTIISLENQILDFFLSGRLNQILLYNHKHVYLIRNSKIVESTVSHNSLESMRQSMSYLLCWHMLNFRSAVAQW